MEIIDKKLKLIKKIHAVFPSLIPVKNGKATNLEGWQEWCTDTRPFDPNEFKYINYGIPGGPANGVIIVDIDDQQGFINYAMDHGWTPDLTRIHKTGSNKAHYFYLYPDDGHSYGCKAINDPDGALDPKTQKPLRIFDIKALGGYVVGPGSIHPDTNKPYTVEHDLPILPAPQFILDLCRKDEQPSELDAEKTVKGQKNLTHDSALSMTFDDPLKVLASLDIPLAYRKLITEGEKKGARSEAIASVLTTLLKKEVASNVILYLFQSFPIGDKFKEKGSFDKKRFDSELQRIQSKFVPDEPEDLDTYTFTPTDTGNAEHLVTDHGDNIRFCYGKDKWYTWTGKLWKKDEDEKLQRLAKRTVRKIYTQAWKIEDDEKRKKASKWALSCKSRSKRDSMIHLARAEDGVHTLPQDYNQDPFLLNCTNGTLDLRTGELRPHQREDMLSKIIDTDFDPEATAPRWEQFLWEVTDEDEDLMKCLQRCIGYALTGDCREDAFFMLYGAGSNGKSTFLETISSLLGPYAVTTEFSTFLIQRNEKVRNDIAALHGKRFVSSMEVEKGKKFAESLLKTLTGRDTISTRFLFHEFFTFKPEFKIFLSVNHRPGISGTDHAIWRRVKLIPFTVRFPEEEQDKELPSKLKEELPGILSWAVKGCLDWQSEGLFFPDKVKDAIEDYKTDMDLIGPFLADCCKLYPDNKEFYEKTSDLYSVYISYCKINGDDILKKNQFSSSIKERGLTPQRIGHTQARGWSGITITTSGWSILKDSTEIDSKEIDTPF